MRRQLYQGMIVFVGLLTLVSFQNCDSISDRQPAAVSSVEPHLTASALADSTHYVYRNFTSSRGQLVPYRLLVPLDSSLTNYPLVVYLHGDGCGGTDNEGQMINGALTFDRPRIRAKFPAFEVVPQFPDDEHVWNTIGDPLDAAHPENGATEIALAVFELVDSLKAEFQIDAKRVYAVGLSRGAFGVWDWLVRRPDLFAAGIPMSGTGTPSIASHLVNTPIWATHGANDPVVDVGDTRAMIQAIRAAGGHPNYTEFTVGGKSGHGDWGDILETTPGLLDWLFTQRAP